VYLAAHLGRREQRVALRARRPERIDEAGGHRLVQARERDMAAAERIAWIVAAEVQRCGVTPAREHAISAEHGSPRRGVDLVYLRAERSRVEEQIGTPREPVRGREL